MQNSSLNKIYLDYCFFIIAALEVFSAYDFGYQAPQVIVPFVIFIFLPYFIWIENINNKNLTKCLIGILLLACCSIFDKDIISTDVFRFLVSLKFILFISSFLAFIIIFSSIKLQKLLSKKHIGLQDFIDLNMSLICIISFFIAIVLYKNRDVFFSFGDYYQTIIYYPFLLLKSSIFVICLQIISKRKLLKKYLIFCFLSIVLLLIILFSFCLLYFKAQNIIEIASYYILYLYLALIGVLVFFDIKAAILISLIILHPTNVVLSLYLLMAKKVNNYVLGLVIFFTIYHLIDIDVLYFNQYNLSFKSKLLLDAKHFFDLISKMLMLILIIKSWINKIYVIK